ncbi:MAG: DUF1127 domain-containing protein [Pikeienuella sp.]
MAYITNTTAAAHNGNGLGAFSGLVARYNAWRSYRATVRALNALTDAELNDIGLTRGQIELAARGVI